MFIINASYFSCLVLILPLVVTINAIFIARMLFQLCFIVASYWCDQKALNVKSQFIRQINETEYCTDDFDLQLWHQPFKKIIKTWEGSNPRVPVTSLTPQSFELDFAKVWQDVSKWWPRYCLCIRCLNSISALMPSIPWNFASLLPPPDMWSMFIHILPTFSF